jgi:predicted nucleotidyltransferase
MGRNSNTNNPINLRKIIQPFRELIPRSIRNKSPSPLLNLRFKNHQLGVLTMKKTTLPINLSQEEIKQFCQRHSICKLSLFGSVLRDDFTRESDVDVLVEFEQGKTPGLAIITMEDELSNIINRQIDLRTSADLSRYFREQVLAEAIVIYEQN